MKTTEKIIWISAVLTFVFVGLWVTEIHRCTYLLLSIITGSIFLISYSFYKTAWWECK